MGAGSVRAGEDGRGDRRRPRGAPSRWDRAAAPPRAGQPGVTRLRDLKPVSGAASASGAPRGELLSGRVALLAALGSRTRRRVRPAERPCPRLGLGSSCGAGNGRAALLSAGGRATWGRGDRKESGSASLRSLLLCWIDLNRCSVCASVSGRSRVGSPALDGCWEPTCQQLGANFWPAPLQVAESNGPVAVLCFFNGCTASLWACVWELL